MSKDKHPDAPNVVTLSVWRYGVATWHVSVSAGEGVVSLGELRAAKDKALAIVNELGEALPPEEQRKR